MLFDPAEAPARLDRPDGETLFFCSRGCRDVAGVNKLDGVEASVNYATDRAAVRFDPRRVVLEELIQAVEATGYGAALPEAAEQVDAGAAPRLLRLRPVVAAALSAPLVVRGRYFEARARRRSSEVIRAVLELGAKEARGAARGRRGARTRGASEPERIQDQATDRHCDHAGRDRVTRASVPS